MGHEFLSATWMTEVQALREEYAEQLPDLPIPPLWINLHVTDAPETVAADGVLLAHAHTGRASLVLGTGPLEQPDLTVTVDYDTAYDLLVDQRPNAAIGAFLAGRVQISGDLEALAAQGSLDPASIPQLLAALGATGAATLADIDPTAAEIGDRIRALTA